MSLHTTYLLTTAVCVLVALTATASATPLDSPCRDSDASSVRAVGERIGQAGTWLELASALDLVTSPTTEGEALAAVCEEPGCDGTARAVRVLDYPTVDLYVRAPGKAWHRFPGVLHAEGGAVGFSETLSPDGRHLFVGLRQELLTQVETAECQGGQLAGTACPRVLETRSAGVECAHLVIDLETMALVLERRLIDRGAPGERAAASPSAREGAGCTP